MWIAASVSAFGRPDSDEVSLKALFLWNFAKFVEWPVTGTRSLDFCVMGDDRMAAALETSLAGKSIGMRPVTVRNRPDLRELHLCSVIYIGQAEKKVAPQVAKSVAGKQILTVSEFPELGPEGVAISFFLDHDRVRFEVHLGAVSQAGLKISSKLLQLARITDDRK